MEMSLDIANILYLISFLSPLYVTFFMLMSSVFNQDVKALVWLGGVALFTMVVLGLQILFKHRVKESRNQVCGAFSLFSPVGQYDVPSVASYFIAFTLAYLMLPMMNNKSWNYFVIIWLRIVIHDRRNRKGNWWMHYLGRNPVRGITGILIRPCLVQHH